jgi:hypothetical protein
MNQRNYLRQNNRGASKRKSRHSGGGGSSNTSEVKTEALKQMQKKLKVMEATITSLQASQALTGFRLLPQYWGRILGSFFYRGVSPSKIGPIAPY